MSTYSSNLRIELITTGDQAGTWGTTTNTNLGTLLEDAISGYTSVSITSASQALTALNGAADQSRNVMLALTTTTTAAFSVYAPPAEKTYIIANASSYAATIYNSTVIGNTTAAGLGVVIPAGKTVPVWSDGTNFYVQVNHLPTLSLTNDLAIADGGTGASTAADARTNLGLGTMATQNANNVNITGGTIGNIADLSVADGGTGASTPAGARSNLGVPANDGTNANGIWPISITGNAVTATTATTASALSSVLGIAGGGTGATNVWTARSNLQVPSIDGTGSYGTWPISITGSAGSATTATYVTATWSNGYGARTVSSATPSGGSDGDIWYKI